MYISTTNDALPYFQGDDKMKGYRRHTFASSRAISRATYSVSKVADRVNSESGRYPFLADGDFRHSDSDDI